MPMQHLAQLPNSYLHVAMSLDAQVILSLDTCGNTFSQTKKDYLCLLPALSKLTGRKLIIRKEHTKL